MTAVAETEPLLVFAKLQRLHLLAELSTEVLIPPLAGRASRRGRRDVGWRATGGR